LIESHLDMLAGEMVQWARATDPHEFPADRDSDYERFRRFYHTIAEALATGDRQAAVATYEKMAEERLRTKVRADSIIRLVDHGGDRLAHLIGDQAVSEEIKADALRQARNILATCRMILSKVNIYLMTHPD
jgi:hypothetical protein